MSSPPAPPGPTGASPARSGRRVLLPPDSGAPRRARRLVREVLEGAGREEWVDAAELAVSELVTNAALHARTDVEVDVEVHPEHVRVEVRDSNPSLPSQRHYGEQATTGRGMALVASVSADCGVTALPDGKVVWFEVRGQQEDPSEEDLLAAWDEEQWEVPGAAGAPGAGTAPPAALSTVRLLGVPPTLWAATRQHHDAVLRELGLYLTTHDGVTADLAAVEVARQSFSNALIAAAEDARRRTPVTSIPSTGLPTALEPIDVELDLPAEVGPAAAALQDALDTAERLAARGELLALPGQAEVVAVRDWVCDQVRSQLRGGAPWPWQGARDERFETPAPGTGPAAVPDEALTAVLDEAARRGRGLVAVDAGSRVLAVSAGLAAALGWAVDDLVGRRVVAIIPPALREAHIAGFSRHLHTGESRVLGKPLVLPVLHADGREVTCGLLIERRPTPAGRWLYLAWIDPPGDADPA
ncbi:ATP-binding protein [Kineococcus radiotolerans]|uniref:PAS/PAC sensor protein n=1 Tax=Kineococcus radiotolerans (strain ATCC BAA-149 / DSM 14245 / SRS30216) TaxID=266940 RepID=A6W473_KINRD|nr:ATP-binding protein [Kineococcus radiotolerans]ABS01612.1 putative PAS/PAC sensor protein [Kineococcus radiotolerans SRS30216 = ATCC BAA-149]